MPSDDLFASLFIPAPLREAVAGHAWVQAMLDAEAALARAEARAGIVPNAAAQTIAACAAAAGFDAEVLGREGQLVGNPAEPLARALAATAGDAGRWVHHGATSQDIVDSAAMLVAARTLPLVTAELRRAECACAGLADEHRGTLLAGRTLLQQALPTTFGLKAAGWLVGLAAARRRLEALRLPAQLGGAAGTLAALGDLGPEVLQLYAAELGLEEPVLPWHTLRAPVAELGAALELAAGAVAKVALDLILLAQTEVREVRDTAGGASSAMPHKRNPVGAVLATTCSRRAQAEAGMLTGALAQEHERATGAWQAEWEAIGGALAATGAAAAHLAGMLEGLEVDVERMAENLQATSGMILSERVVAALGEPLGRFAAHDLMREVCAVAAAAGTPLRRALADDPRLVGVLSEAEIDELLDPAGYVGAAEAFVDRALHQWRMEGAQ